MERTFIMIKPDGVERKFIGDIVNRFEKRGFVLVAAKLMTLTDDVAMHHYREHKKKSFFQELIDFITSGPVFVMVLEGENVVELSRGMIGHKNPSQALPGTIRGDLTSSLSENIIHGSDSKESAEYEISLFFDKSELM